MTAKTGNAGYVVARLWRRGAFGVVAMMLALFACYGVLALTALLPLLGMRLVLDPAVWGGAIAGFTVLTVLAVTTGIRAHGAWMPLTVACAGAALILYALLVDYHMLVEFAGFVSLAAAVVLDRRLHRRVRRMATARAATGHTAG